MKRLLTKISTLSFLFVLFGSMMLVAQTGSSKLAGKVMDADTKEALIGANILIMGTGLGAATDINGEYFVLNVTPGTYDVRVSFVGYASQTIQNVRMVAGITYELNVDLSTDFTLPEILITSRNRFFEEKATNTVRVFDADQIAKIPVKGIANIAALQSGVVIQDGSGGADGNAAINVRGGRSSEVLYIIDGIPQNNLYNRSSAAQVSNAAIEQISFQVGGFEAKYGQAQSGIINVTTKSGSSKYTLLGDVLTSSFTDDYGYNLYTSTFGGPIIPSYDNHTFFVSVERGWFKDANPSYISVDFPTIEQSYKTKPNNAASVWRYSGRTNHTIGDFSLRLGMIGNNRISNLYTHRMAKNSSDFFDEFTQDNYSYSARLSHNLSSSSFYNITLGFRKFELERYNPYFKDDLESYGDSTLWADKFGVTLLANGQRVLGSTDAIGVFRPYGWSWGIYQHRENETYSLDFDFSTQIDNHLFEIGFGAAYHIIRTFAAWGYELAGQSDTLSLAQRYANIAPTVYGYDVTGKNKTNLNDPNIFLRPKNPLIGYAYIQDRFELSDLVLNLGIRLDYFDLKSLVLKNPEVPFAGGSDPKGFDEDDFMVRDVDFIISPRIGIGFPVTASTVFHFQYGKFIQYPELNDLYFGPFDYDDYLVMSPQFGFNGGLKNEETSQYEIGFKQMLGDNAAINITLFYNNTRNLVNVQNNKFRRNAGGQILDAIYPVNADFGTNKGIAFSFDASRIGFLSVSANYTLALAEGTGSSTSSSQTAVFRNQDNQAPKVIAPLNFDQRHTATVNLDYSIPEGHMNFMELSNLNVLISYNSGRPYTPMDRWNLLGDNGLLAITTGYINSRYYSGSFRIDLKLEKTIKIGKNLFISPYLWIENLLNSENFTSVYRSTGNPNSTGWLTTDEGKTTAKQQGENWVSDYQMLERNPDNFGIPRLIKLGIKVNFSGLSF